MRTLHLVTWNSTATPRELGSAAAVQAARASGELTIEQPGVVANMPLLTWPGGHR